MSNFWHSRQQIVPGVVVDDLHPFVISDAMILLREVRRNNFRDQWFEFRFKSRFVRHRDAPQTST